MFSLGQVGSQAALWPRAKWFYNTLTVNAANLWCSSIEVFRDEAGGFDLIKFNLLVDLPSRPKVQIASEESIVVRFADLDNGMPEVFALRADFPLVVSHRNITTYDRPVSLCLTDQKWLELKGSWTPVMWIELIRWWLNETARGKLHRSDQPLEPFMAASAMRIVIPNGSLEGQEYAVLLPNNTTLPDAKCLHLIAIGPNPRRNSDYLCVSHRMRPCVHGPIQRAPVKIRDVIEAVHSTTGEDLRAILVEKLRSIPTGQRKKKLLLLLEVPLVRVPGGSETIFHYIILAKDANVTRAGISLGAWENEQYAQVLHSPAPNNYGQFEVFAVVPVYEFGQEAAKALSGSTGLGKVLAIGCGSLGSQILFALARSGLDRLDLIDDDVLLPHNLSRHILDGMHVGRCKAIALAEVIQRTTQTVCKSIPVDFLNPDAAHIEDMHRRIADADIVFDFSASVAVSRLLSMYPERVGRKGSSFLNPTGQDLVIMLESRDRFVDLFDLEAHYFRAIATNGELAHHIPADHIASSRYGRGCSDYSTVMSPGLVHGQAGTAIGVLLAACGQDEAYFGIFRKATDGVTEKISMSAPRACYKHRIGDWLIAIHQEVIEECVALRRDHLPAETGGVLVGRWDLDLKFLQVVAMIPAPSDSAQSATEFVRGSRGLAARIQGFRSVTGGQVSYIGEWHSHPRGHSTVPSATDVAAIAMLTHALLPDGLPALQVIVSDDGRPGITLGLPVELTWPS